MSRTRVGHYRVILIAVILLVVYAIAVKLSSTVFPHDYLDEEYYIVAGRRYLQGGSISEINWEHPPLAKYIIGASEVCLGDPHIVTFIAGYITLLFFYLTLFRISYDTIKSLLASTILSSEIPFIKIFNYALLDDFSILFSSIAFYLALLQYNANTNTTYNNSSNNRRFFLAICEGVLWGAAVASKWTSMYLLFGRVFFEILFNLKDRKYMKNTRYFGILLMTAVLVYVATFLEELTRSLSTFFLHNLRMVEFMVSHHSISIHTLTKGLTMLFFKTTFWHRYPDVFITLTMSNSSIVNYTIHYARAPDAVEIDILPAFGGLLLPLIPFALVYGILQFRTFSLHIKAIFVVSLTSLIPVFHGSIPWYFVYASYFWGLFITSVIPKKYLFVILTVNIVYYFTIILLGLNKLIILVYNI